MRMNLRSFVQERPTPWLRQLLAVGVILRWAGLGVAGVIGVLAPPRATSLLVGLILAVGVYNTASMWLVGRIGDQAVLPIAFAITLLDELGCLVFLAVFSGLPGGTQIAFYVPMVVEAIAFGGVVGAGQAVVVFGIGIVAVEWAQRVYLGGSFSWAVVLLWILVMLVVSASIAALDQSLQRAMFPAIAQLSAERRGPTTSGAPNLQLSRREQEVLRLIAGGYSDAMIAAQLHLSETTVKTHVGTLRTRLGARTRAEAVAIASRLSLLDREASSEA